MPESEKINNRREASLRILIAPLDWGLGHTTRCLPIIRTFLELGADVTVAGNEKQAHLLCNEIPSLNWLPLRGYNFNYSRTSLTTHLKIFLQVPKLLIAIKRENRWLKKVAKQRKFDIIISDNRYGLRHKQIYSLFITHQLRIRVPINQWLEKILQKWNYHFINKFDECWVPDYKDEPNLAGKLSHPSDLPSIALNYVGPLSRFRRVPSDSPQIQLLLIIISGPEPQRSMFENIIEEQLRSFPGHAVVLRGLPDSNVKKEGFANVSFINHLPSDEMNRLIQEASLILCRAGYSSIMDLVKMQKKSILVPTPGQTEQEYLASYLMSKSFFLAFNQENFSLNAALDAAKSFDFTDMRVFNQMNLSSVVQELLDRIEVKSPHDNGFNQ